MATDYEQFVRQHGRFVYAVVQRVLGPCADVDDVVQDVFIEYWPLFRARSAHCDKSLIRRMATCRAIDCLRARKPSKPLTEAIGTQVAEPSEVAVQRELAQELRRAIAELPRRQAEVFCLRFFEDLTNAEIAELLHINATAVSTALHKSRKSLVDRLSRAIKER